MVKKKYEAEEQKKNSKKIDHMHLRNWILIFVAIIVAIIWFLIVRK